MPRRRIQAQVFPAYRTMVSLPWLRGVAAQALEIADPDGRSSASVVVADDDTLRDLNHRFRGLDEETDVLSFADRQGPMEPTAPDAGTPAFPQAPEEEGVLGEVVVSYPQAALQAAEHGWPVEQEVALLVVHGVLHLLGHDHAEPDEEATMKALEDEALTRLFPGKAVGAWR